MKANLPAGLLVILFVLSGCRKDVSPPVRGENSGDDSVPATHGGNLSEAMQDRSIEKQISENPAIVDITAVDYINEFRRDDYAHKDEWYAKYVDQAIRMRGRVKHFVLFHDGEIVLSGAERSDGVSCRFAPEEIDGFGKLAIGQQIVIVGVGQKDPHALLVADCKLESSGDDTARVVTAVKLTKEAETDLVATVRSYAVDSERGHDLTTQVQGEIVRITERYLDPEGPLRRFESRIHLQGCELPDGKRAELLLLLPIALKTPDLGVKVGDTITARGEINYFQSTKPLELRNARIIPRPGVE